MAIMDVGLYQDWIAAHDNWDRARRRFDAAGQIGDAGLIEHLRIAVERARVDYNAATKAINNA